MIRFRNCFLLLAFMCPFLAVAETLHLPQGKGHCPNFKMEAPQGWHLKIDRKAGDRWLLLNNKRKSIARFDYNLPNTDQKQMTEVESKEIQLGAFRVEKYTVTGAPVETGGKATEGLITSYSYRQGLLQGLVVMSEEYSASSDLDKKIEKILATIQTSPK